jgi:SagB-type dehydrogenase family enzyme
VRIRRARSLTIAWREGRLVFTNYLTQASVTADPETVRVLNLLEDWTDPSSLLARMPEYSQRSILESLRVLQKHTLVLSQGTPEAVRDEKLARAWSDWLPDGSFHFTTKDVQFMPETQVLRYYKRYLAESPQPPLTKKYKLPRIPLPRPSLSKDEFTRTLFARRTHREFTRQAISLEQAAKLLYATWGVQGEIDAPPFGRLFLKTSPSGGARHPGEVYMLALRVKGLREGLYHYNGLKHHLERIRSVPAKKKAVEYSAGHEFLKNASAVFIMTAVFPRSQWKYRFSRAYRVVLLDQGHLCQTFCLVATWMGLAPFCTAALKESVIEKDLGLDGIEEAPLYLAAVGVPLDSGMAVKRRRRR